MNRRSCLLRASHRFHRNPLSLVASLAAASCAAFAGAGAAQQTPRPLGETAAPYGYYEYLPFGYTGASDELWPVVLFLHGIDESGNGGTQLSRVLSQGVPQKINTGVNYPFIAISPQTGSGWSAGTIDSMVEYVKTTYRVDVNRIYVTGLSMGGGGTWNYAEAHAAKLAAVMPICGADGSSNGIRLKNLPTWAFHSYGDTRVTSMNSINWVNDIAGDINGEPPTNAMANYPGVVTGPPGPGNRSDKTYTASFDAASKTWTWKLNVPAATQGAHPMLTLYPDTSHNSWSRTYNDQDAWNWLLAQTRFSATGANNKAASVKIDAPANNAEFDAGIDLTIRATIADSDGTVAKVEFYAGGTKLGEDNAAPYQFVWNDMPAGTHWISVKATDNAGSTNASLVKISVTPATGDPELGIVPVTAGVAAGSAFFPLERAFDAQPTLDAAGAPQGGTGGMDAPLYSDRHGYIDFGPEWYKVRITSTWTRYRASSVGNQAPYADLWWDDDTNTVNDGGFVETRFNFNSATGLSTGGTEPWLKDSDLGAAPAAPKARYLILHSPAAMTNRAKEYAIVGFIEPNATP